MSDSNNNIGNSKQYKEVSLAKDKYMWLSMGASIISFAMNFVVSFFLTPFLIGNLGEAEYSFYPLASSFVSYITIATVALNSMAGRFVTIARHRGDEQEAREYFASAFYANLILSLVLLPFMVIFIIRIDAFINVPAESVLNVQLLFSMILFCLILGQVGTVFSIAPYCCDRLYLNNLSNIVSHLVMAIGALLMFSLFPAKLYYVGIMNLSSAAVVFLLNYAFTRRLLPEMKIKREFLVVGRVKTLISSGIWNSISQLSNVLLNGVDLFIANRYLGPEATALISISKVLPNNLSSMVSTVANVFQPRFARQYAHNDTQGFALSLTSSIRLMGLIFCLPIAFLIIFGDSFFSLWVPSMDAGMLQILSILGMGVLFISASLNPVYGVFTVTNKIKINSLVVLFTGVLNVVIVIGLMHFATDQTTKMLIIVGVSTAIGIVRNLTFTIIYTAKCMNLKWSTFYKPIIINLFYLVGSALLFLGVKYIIPSNQWATLILCGFVGAIICLIFAWIFVLGRNERKQVLSFLFRKKEK